MFIIDNEVVIVSVVNENIQIDFSDDDVPLVAGIIDIGVVSIVDNKVLVDDGIIVDVGVKVTPISYINITKICNVTISYQVVE